MSRTLLALRDAGRRDLLGLLATHRLTLPEVHDAYARDPASLEHLRAKAESLPLGSLVDEWLAWCKSPAGLSPRTTRPYTPKTVRRYAVSWEGFYAAMVGGRETGLNEVTHGFLRDYRRLRVRATGGRKRKEVAGRPVSAATFNRDMAALSAFFTWLHEVKGMTVDRPKLPHEQEPRGRERWLAAEELRAFQQECPVDWWPFFSMPVLHRARVWEPCKVSGALTCSMSAKRIVIHEADRRVKSSAAVRDLPIPQLLKDALGVTCPASGRAPPILSFRALPELRGGAACLDATCDGARIVGATPHDARHTFAVHATSGRACHSPRLQKLLGHSTPIMTLRYMQHAPEAFLDADAAAIASHLSRGADQGVAGAPPRPSSKIS